MKKKIIPILVAATAALSFASPKVGYLGTNCPAGYSQSTIKMDVEDSNNQTRFLSGNALRGISGIGEGVVTWKICTTSDYVWHAPFDYVVFRMDSKCPDGTFAFSRHHDTEDKRNQNSYSGYIGPNVVDNNITFEFCFVPGAPRTQDLYFPALKNLAVFANYKKYDVNNKWPSVKTSRIFIDDEDSNNGNYWSFSKEAEPYKDRIWDIMEGSNNTTYYISFYAGGAIGPVPNPPSYSNVAKKQIASAEAAAVTPVAAAPVVKSASSAAVKNISREVVGVELQTAGDVEISVVGINGHVFAKFSAQNLQPGFHNINWNSASVPAGHYVVSIKHNGSIAGKNVLLK